MRRDNTKRVTFFICILASTLCWGQVVIIHLVSAQELQTQTREIILGTSDNELCIDMVLDSEDNIILVGSVESKQNREHSFLITRVSSGGDSLWYKSWSYMKHDWLVSVDIDSMDNLVVAGVSSTLDEITTRNGSVTKLDTEGNEIWSVEISNVFYEWLTPVFREGYFSVQVDRNSDDIFVVGTTTEESEHAFITCINASGSIEWERILDDSELGWTVATSLWLTPRSQVVIAMEGQLHSYIMGFDFNGTNLWNATDMFCQSGQEMANGDLIVVTSRDRLAKYSSDFEQLWELDIELQEPYDGELTGFTLNGSHNLVGFGMIHNIKTQNSRREYQALFTPAPSPQTLIISCSLEGEILEYGFWSKGDVSIPAGCEINTDGVLVLAGHTADFGEDKLDLYIIIGFELSGLPSPISSFDYSILLVIILPLCNLGIIGYFKRRENRYLEKPPTPPRSVHDSLRILFGIEFVIMILYGGIIPPFPGWMLYLSIGLTFCFLGTTIALILSWQEKRTIKHEES